MLRRFSLDRQSGLEIFGAISRPARYCILRSDAVGIAVETYCKDDRFCSEDNKYCSNIAVETIDVTAETIYIAIDVAVERIYIVIDVAVETIYIAIDVTAETINRQINQ